MEATSASATKAFMATVILANVMPVLKVIFVMISMNVLWKVVAIKMLRVTILTEATAVLAMKGFMVMAILVT